MRLEFHQLDRRWQRLRVREPHRQRRLLASLAEHGQQTPIIVVAAAENSDRYIVIDGFKRIAALEQLRRDTVEGTLWAVSEAEALLLERSLRAGAQETVLEQGWLLQEMERQFGYTQQELARRFDRSESWVSRRLALVELLPEEIQQQVRDGRIASTIAMKYLAPMARVSVTACRQFAAALLCSHCDTRQAGELYAAWRDGTAQQRERILAEPALFLKARRACEPPDAAVRRDLETATAILHRVNAHIGEALAAMDEEQREQTRRTLEAARRQLRRIGEQIDNKEPEHAEPGGANRDSRTEREAGERAPDRAGTEDLATQRAQGAAFAIVGGAATAPVRESRTLPPAHPGAFRCVQGESRASP